MNDIKRNFIYNAILTSSQLLFPIITFPYASRILGPKGIGLVTFSDLYSKYFAIVAALGIPIYGIREISRVRASGQMNTTFSEIFLIHLGTTLAIFFIYLSSILFVPRLREDLMLHLLSSLNILLGVFAFDWFFSGLEKFKLIAIRSIVSKLLLLPFLFLSVKDENDYVLFQLLNVLTLFVNVVLNVTVIRKYVRLELEALNFRRHFRPLLTIFSSSILVSMYTVLDTVMLGFLSTKEAVGYYTASVRLNKIIVVVIASLGGVLIPKLSALAENQDLTTFKDLISKSLRFVLLLSIPAITGLIMLREEIIIFFSGADFLDAQITVGILAPIILLIALSNIFGMQILIPLKKDKQFLLCVCVGMGINVLLNLILIPRFSYNGAAIATLIAELSVALITLYYARKNITFSFPVRSIFNTIVASILLIPAVLLVRNFYSDTLYIIVISGALGLVIYFSVQIFIYKEPLLISVKKQLQSNFIKSKDE